MTDARCYCGYSLRGLPTDTCPECGQRPKLPMPEPPHFDIAVSAKGLFLLGVLLALMLAAALT